MSFLPRDFCRCHSSGCPVKDECDRWIQRDTGDVHSALPYTDSGCKHRIRPVDEIVNNQRTSGNNLG